MPPKKTTLAVSPSPDPLSGDAEDFDDAPSPRKSKATTPKSTHTKTTPRKHKATPSNDTPTSAKRRKLNDASPTPARAPRPSASASASASKKRTPLSKASPASNVPRSTPVARPPKSETTPSKRGIASSSRKAMPTLAAGAGRTLPTPTRVHRDTPKSTKKDSATMPNFDEAFEPASHGVTDTLGTREMFLTNESMKRAREARNFLYEGDKDAPKLTRSGRVVGGTKSRGRDREVDEYGEVLDAEADTEDEEGSDDPDGPGGDEGADSVFGGEKAGKEDGSAMDVDEQPRYGAIEDLPDVHAGVGAADETNAPLPAYVRAHFVNILHTLTAKGSSSNPPAFENEGTNEALSQLSAVLKGTVERGEGNSALLVGPRGSGKTRTVARALQLLEAPPKSAPIVVKLSGHAQTNDRLAIREMGRQIAEAEGGKLVFGEDDEAGDEDAEEYAPTTLPSHLLALLTAPSPRAIVIIMEEFDLFTEHARQALLYCLLDVVQSVKTGPVESTGRGVAVIGVTTRTDTLLLLEKRVKSRFSHRIFRVVSPLAPKTAKEGEEEQDEHEPWQTLLKRALVPWASRERTGDEEEDVWRGDWEFAIETLLVEPRVVRYMTRLSGLSSDVRNLYRPFIPTIAQMLSTNCDFILAKLVSAGVIDQIEGAGWGLQNTKIRGLPAPALGILIISKHLHYAGREEFNFAQVEEEYLRFARTKLVGSGKTRWAIGVLRNAFDHLLRLGILLPTSSASVRPQFQRVRCTITPHEVVAWFKGEGANSLGPELGNWGRMMGGHA